MVSAISLLAVTNYIAKIYYILKFGEKSYKNKSDLDEYIQPKKAIEENCKEDKKNIFKYFQKPRIGEINELDAFVTMIRDCEIDFGLNINDRTEIENTWKHFRNKLTHLAGLKGNLNDGQMLVTQNIKNGSFEANMSFIINRSDSYTGFEITKPSLRKSIIENNETSKYSKQFIIKDKLYIEYYNKTIKKLLTWIINLINSSTYDKNIKILYKWIKTEFDLT